MADFYEVLDEYMGDINDVTDIRVCVRRLWFYDFNGYPIRVWQGQGRLHTADGNIWMGTIDASGRDIHTVPAISDGRDGSSASYNFTLLIPDIPGQAPRELYDALKSEQWRVSERKLICYLAIFKEGEGLRPETPISFMKELTMISPKFSEKVDLAPDRSMLKSYSVSILAKDGNFGRSEVPGGTYADTIQKARARELGVALDRGSEFLARIADRTYQLP